MDRNNIGIVALIIIIIFVILFFGAGMWGSEGEEGEVILPGGGPGSSCAATEDCAEGLICVAGICTDDSCGPGDTCPLGFICIGDTCIDGSCGEDPVCPPGFECVGGFCFPIDEISCETNADCPPGQECIDNICQDIPILCGDDGDCPPGQECVAGLCQDLIPCAEDSDCPPGQECIGGYCTDIECEECALDSDCGINHVCVSGCCEFQEEEYSVCAVTCEDSSDCGPLEVCSAGCCVPPIIFTTTQIGGWMAETLYSDFCEGCPEEDSLVSMMFLDPDIAEKTVSVTLVVEQADKSRDLVEDGTVFVEVIPSDGSASHICRILTDETGTATFDYSTYSECPDVGCKLKFTFCCSNVGEECLIPVCLDNPAIQTYDSVSPCDSSVVSWELQAKVEGTPTNIYPVIDMLTVPPEPKLIGSALSFELCLPILVIFGLLSAAMFMSGRNPFQMFSFYAPRFKRAPQRAVRARGLILNVKSIISNVASAAQGIGKSSKGRTLGAKVKGAKKSMKKMKKISAQGRAIKGGRVTKVVDAGPKTGTSSATSKKGETAGGKEGAGVARASMDVGGSMDMLQMTGGGTFGGSMKAFGALFGTAFLGKLLSGSGLTSWVVYGTGEKFKGLLRGVEGKLKAANAPALQKEMALLLAETDFKVTEAKGPDGKPLKGPNGETLYVVSYNDLGAVSPEKSKITGGSEAAPVVESKPMTAAEVENEWGGVVAPAVMLGAMSAQIAGQEMMKEGNVLHDAQQDAAAAGHEIYGVSVGEPISANEAGMIVSSPDPKVSGLDAAAAIVKADSLTTDTGTRLTDGKKFGEWANSLNAQAQGGPPIPDSDLRMGAEIYHKAVEELGAEAVAKNENLAALGAALVAATPADPQTGEITPEAAGFGLYVQSMVADANTQAQFRGAQANAMAALGTTYDAAVALEEQGEGARTNLTQMMDSFGADKRGEMGNPSRYTDNQQYIQSMNRHLIEHQSFMLQNGIDEGKTTVGEYLSSRNVFGSRKNMIKELKETMDAQKPEPPARTHDRDAAQHDLYLAMGAHPYNPDKMPEGLKKEFERVEKVEAANMERFRIEKLRMRREQD